MTSKLGAGNHNKAYCLEKGFSDYLLKPYTQKEILMVVAQLEEDQLKDTIDQAVKASNELLRELK